MRPVVLASSLVLVLALSGCGGKDEPSTSTKTTAPSASSSASATPTPTQAPTGNQGAVELAPADQAEVPKSGCTPQPAAGLVCQGKQGYRFQPDAVRRAGVASAKARHLDQGGWAVDITLGPAGTTALASVTKTAASTRQLVVVMVSKSRRVLFAAQVQDPITTGILQVSGSFTEAQAGRIVKQITRTSG